MKINYRQTCILILMAMIALKFLALPSLLYVHSENMSIFVSLVLMIVDAIYAVVIMGMIERNGNKNAYEFMRDCIGTVGAKMVLFILMLVYGLGVANIAKGLEFFVVENLYSELNWSVYVLPLMILLGFMVYKGIRNIARVSEVFTWLILVGIIYIGFKSIGGIELDSFLPLFPNGVKPLLEAGFHHMAWFGSSSFLLMLFGKVDFRDKKKSKLFWYIFIAIFIVHFMYIIFYGLFQVTSSTHNFLLSDVSQFSTEHSSIDELSWLIVSLWIVAQAIQLALYCYSMEQSIKFLFNIKNNTLPIALVMVYILVWSLLGENTVNLEEVFFTPYVSILTIVAAYVIPIILLIVSAIKRGRRPKAKSKIKRASKISLSCMCVGLKRSNI